MLALGVPEVAAGVTYCVKPQCFSSLCNLYYFIFVFLLP